jgi:hypothetical protein
VQNVKKFPRKNTVTLLVVFEVIVTAVVLLLVSSAHALSVGKDLALPLTYAVDFCLVWQRPLPATHASSSISSSFVQKGNNVDIQVHDMAHVGEIFIIRASKA